LAQRFLVVDDHPLFRSAVQSAVTTAFPGAEVAEATSIGAVREAISASPEVDLILLDLSLPDTTGFEGLLELRTHYPRIPVVIVSAMEDNRIIHEAMTYGASGFIPKSTPQDRLQSAIKDVIAGKVYLPSSYVAPDRAEGDDADADLARRLSSLTPQQLRVLRMLRQGLLNKQIAFELKGGETTVKAHVSEILRKLNVASRTQAVIEVAKIDFDHVLGGEDYPR